MYYAIGASVSSLHRESTDSLILYNVCHNDFIELLLCYVYTHNDVNVVHLVLLTLQ